MAAVSPPQERRKVASTDVHRALLGQRAGLAVEMQAYRFDAHSSDELVLLHAHGEYWVAARFGERTCIWSCHDLEAAQELFDERLLQGARWRLAAAS